METARTTKTLLNLLGNIFASWEANFVSATMFPKIAKWKFCFRNNVSRDGKHVSAMFPTLPRTLVSTYQYPGTFGCPVT